MKTYIIRLNDNETSQHLAKSAIESVEKHNLDYTIFNGFPPKEGLQYLNNLNIRFNASIARSEWTPGTFGCFASHYKLWTMCSQSTENMLIIEHDGVLLKDPTNLEFDEACHLDRYIPFSSQHGMDDTTYSTTMYTTNTNGPYKAGVYPYPKNKFYGSDEITGSCFRALYGYILSPKGATKLLKFVDKFGAFPADKTVCERAVNIQRANCTYVRLNPELSSINKQNRLSTR